MLIFADENIPFVKEAFSTFGKVITFSGRRAESNRIREADILLVRSVTEVNRGLLEGTKIRFVATATIGTDHIDMDYLKKNGVGFASASGSNANSVAEYIMSAILCLANKLGFSLSGIRLGVIGVGNVGSRVARMAAGLRMEALKNDPPLKRKERRSGKKDIEYRQLKDVIKTDIITLHVPLIYTGRDATFHMVNEKFLSQLKKGTILINTSRGPVVDTKALYEALRKKKLLATVMDVWENEPEIDIALLKEVTIATPHIAGYSFDGKVNGTAMIYRACAEFFGIKPCWRQEEFMPEAPRGELEIKPDGRDEEVLWDTVRRLYDIEKDDIAMREMLNLKREDRGVYFDRLRREYPVRREFFNTTLKIKNCSKKIIDKFLALGFRVEKN